MEWLHWVRQLEGASEQFPHKPKRLPWGFWAPGPGACWVCAEADLRAQTGT